jgi:hypothetical protein
MELAVVPAAGVEPAAGCPADPLTGSESVPGWLRTTRSVGAVGRMATASAPLVAKDEALNW